MTLGARTSETVTVGDILVTAHENGHRFTNPTVNDLSIVWAGMEIYLPAGESVDVQTKQDDAND